MAWKSHQLRSVHQDQAKFSVLANIKSKSIVFPRSGLGDEIHATEISRAAVGLVC